MQGILRINRRDSTGMAAILLAVCLGLPVQAGTLEVPDAVKAAEAARIAVMEQVAPSVVAIFSAGGKGGGSGVLIDRSGFAVTNFHVVQGQGGFMKCGLNDRNIYDAVLVGLDPTGDLALIQLLGRDDFPFARLGNSDDVRAGDEIFAMGNPFLLATDFQPTVTAGIVSGVHRYQYPAGTFLEYTDCIQVDASINPGNSGGPLFNRRGELIGINGRISVEKRGRVNVGAGYAISINQVKHFLDHLKSGRIVDHATLGATVRSGADGSVVISEILESSPAYRRGLRRDDELIAFAGRPIRSVNQFKNILGIYPQGAIVPLSFRREGKRHEIQVPLMSLHRRAELIEGNPFESPPEKEPEQPEKPDDKRDPEHAAPSHPAKAEIPEKYAHLFEERPGFANYYFNARAQERLLRSLDEWGTYSGTPVGWSITGVLNGKTPVQIRMQNDVVAAKLGNEYALQNLGEDFQDLPRNSGGLLAALEQLKHLLCDPRGYFTEIYYLGSDSLPGHPAPVDILVTTKSLVVCRWYFDKSNGVLLGFDSALSEDVDPCEIRFDPLKAFGDVKFPSILAIRHGNEAYGQLAVDSLQFFEPAEQGKQP
jgi:S1-C subfamily serine protease